MTEGVNVAPEARPTVYDVSSNNLMDSTATQRHGL